MSGGDRLLRGLYMATSGMIAQQRQQETISNNLANVNTPGYKADNAVLKSFPEMLIRQLGTKQIPTLHGLKLPVNRQVGSLHTGVYTQETIPSFLQGFIRETGMTTDMAIIDGVFPEETGALFFTVQNENGDTRYTRNGNFTVDGQGFLTTNEGYYVLDTSGNPIQTNGYDFIVSPDGQINGEGVAAELGIVYFANANDLVKGEDNLFNPEGDSQPEDPTVADVTFTVQQRFLEQSNVDPQQSMTQMLQAYRAFEQNQQVLKIYDDSLGRAVNEIGRLG